MHIVQSGIGTISEGDVKSAIAGSVPGVVIGFNVKVDTMAETLARQNGINIETFDIIYKLTEKLEELLQSARPTRHVEEVVGTAKVLKQFSARKGECVVGGKVLSGYLAVKGLVHVTRRGEKLGNGKVMNIQTNKQNADRVSEGSEFGAQIEAPFEIAQGDTIECYIKKTE